MGEDKSKLQSNLTRREALKLLGVGATALVAADPLLSAEVARQGSTTQAELWLLVQVSPG